MDDKEGVFHLRETRLSETMRDKIRENKATLIVTPMLMNIPAVPHFIGWLYPTAPGLPQVSISAYLSTSSSFQVVLQQVASPGRRKNEARGVTADQLSDQAKQAFVNLENMSRQWLLRF
jgi:hypothetical protein